MPFLAQPLSMIALKSELARYGVATAYEAAGRTGLINIPLVQLIPRSRVAGPARTVRCGQGDNLMVHAVMEQVQPGEILVLTMPEPEPVALIGELLATQALVRHVAGILVDAAVRDKEELQSLGLPIWTRWIRVRGATKTHVGTINEIVTVGGASIAPGDLVLLDADGALALAAARVPAILEASRKRASSETTLRAQLQAGALSYDLSGLRAANIRKGSLKRLMKLLRNRFSVVKNSVAIVSITLFFSLLVTLSPAALAAPQQSVRALEPADMQNLIFVWASGTSLIQQKALQICQADSISSANCAAISADVRSAWLDLMQVDPASLGRIGAQDNPAGRTQVYNALVGELSTLTQGREPLLLAQTQQTLQQLDASLQGLMSASATSYTVWATSFTQKSLPDGLKPKTSPYVALPDAYLKYANWGTISNIPSIYQPYYAPNGTKTHWSVTISSANGSKTISNVLVTDVGPWNEDDNWWDANGTSATLPANCPVSPTLIAPDATSNPLVDGICPNGQNLRRIYYYLLYTHNGLPFFQPSGYSPSGNFADGNWPTAIPQGCSESTLASLNKDGITCGGGPDGYNANNGGWLRGGTYDKGITNQSSIDLSPAVNKALGWTYPSSGLIQVNVSALP